MEVKKLLKYGIPESIIKTWEESQGEKLLPLQSSAVTRFNLLNGESLIISAPTSSGKTFCGEMAAISSIFRRKKTVYLVPLKAIAEEKFSDFQTKYSSLGIKVVISTKDRREYDLDLEKGDFDLGIMIYEKFNQLLLKNLDLLRNIDLLIIDELQMIGDSSRGQVLELTLLKVLNSGYKPQIIGLSAVLGEVERLASWSGCKYLLEKKRPVELLQGILYKGRFAYKEYNSQEEGKEEFIAVENEEIENILFPNLQMLLEKGEQVLVFLKSRNETIKMALLFADEFKGEPASEALEKLAELEVTSLKEKLEFCLQKGIAFHNADLTYEERGLVEHSYLEKKIKLVFATSTLAMGVNLPARTVFIETLKYESGEFTDKGVMVPLTWNEYENMSGRAGRFGLEKEFGRSVLLAGNQFHFDSLWDKYVEGKEEKLIPVLDKIDLEDVILDLVSSGLAKDSAGLEKYLANTFSADIINRDQNVINENILKLIEENILISDEKGALYVTALGKVISLQGIKIETGLTIKRKLDKESSSEPVNPNLSTMDPIGDPLGWFYELLKTKDGERIYIPLTFHEIENRVYQEKLKGRFTQDNISEQRLQEFSSISSGQLSSRQLSRLKLSLFFCDWITPAPLRDLENEYGLRSGFISQIAQELAWLLDSTSAIARILNCGEGLEKILKNLAWQVQFGIGQDMIEIAKLKVSGLGRNFLWKLSLKGITSKNQIKEIKLEELKNVIPEKVGIRLKEEIKLQESGKIGRNALPCVSTRRRDSTKSKLILDGSLVKGKYTVILNGRRLLLSHKSFRYLFKLVWAVFKKEDGWIHKLDLEDGDNQGKYIYRLKKELSPSEMALIENNRIGSYRLNLKKDKIDLNKKMLENFQDYDVKELLKEM
jgi:helicase